MATRRRRVLGVRCPARAANAERVQRDRYRPAVGQRNYLIDGVSCSGKTSVATELQRRGYHVIHGDRELAYVGDPETGSRIDEPVALADDRSRAEWSTEHWCWDLDKVKAIVASKEEADTFFCGGSRNFSKFIDLFDAVFVLDVDDETLKRRVEQRPAEEWGAGGSRAEREEALRLHQTKEVIPDGRVIDATVPVARVVDEILRACEGSSRQQECALVKTRDGSGASDPSVRSAEFDA